MNKIILFPFIILLFAAVSCKKDKQDVDQPHAHDEAELITTFQIQFTDTAGVLPPFTATFRDVDGPGGNNPTQFDTIRLSNTAVYRAQILLINEAAIPMDTISYEVLTEGADHLFCFDVTGANLQIQRTDSDGTYEIGLQSLWKTAAISTGNVLIRLKHQPGIKNGSCDPGETDIELNFPVIIE